MRSIIIGDIHGCHRALENLLDKLSPDPEQDRLILLGDLFDRGPDSWDVFQKVKSLAGQFEERFVLLKGNHEDYLLQPRLTIAQRMIWSGVGRQTTVRSFKAHGEKMEDSAAWIREHASMFYKDRFFQCVHAGIKIDPLELNDSYTLLHDHDVVPENLYQGPLTITGHIALQDPAWFAGDHETVETLPEETPLPLPERGVICIDTGCGKGGRLTGMIIEDVTFTLHSTISY